MKHWKLFILLLAFAFSCAREEKPEEGNANRPFPEGEKVEISFSMPVDMPMTRALDGEDDLQSLHLAVFGGSGYLKEYVPAIPVPDGTYTYTTIVTDAQDNPVLDEHGDPLTEEHVVPKFKFTAELTMAESRRTVHLLGNGPSVLSFGWDSDVLPPLLTEPEGKGYWQMISLPKGIRAKKNDAGDYIDKDGNVIPDGGTGYVADLTTSAAFQDIALVRNWSKIVVENSEDSNFTPISYAVINVPAKGTYVPYYSGFVEGYQLKSFTDLDEMGYMGNLPSSDFDRSVPPASAFTSNPLGEGVAPVSGGAVYLYERPVPSAHMPPTFVIVYGYYENDEDYSNRGYYYYKVDLMETHRVSEDEWESSYYPIYRNFKYKININKILSRGQDSPEKAATSAGSADVSADVTTSGVTDISDGVGRLTISPWLAQTFTSERGPNNPVDVLSVHFSHDGITDTNPASVRVDLLPMEDGGEPIIYRVPDPDDPDNPQPFIGDPSDVEGSEGWRSIVFCTAPPGELVRSQILRVTGLYGNNKRLYRDITITIQPIQPLSVKCAKPFIAKTKGTQQVIEFLIPEGLSPSVFPLDFTIEAEDMTLTPDNSVANNNLPVITGTSISDHDGYAGKPAFQFVRTLSWDEYSQLPVSTDHQERTWRSVFCYFKTSRDVSATTVWVYNSYFQKGSVSFEHFRSKEFENLTFTTPVPAASDASLTVSFSMQEDMGRIYPDSYPMIQITARGLICISEDIQPGPVSGTYRYSPTAKNVSIDFVTTTSDPHEIELEFEAEEYEFARLVPCFFRDFGFVDGQSMPISSSKWSNVVYGHVNRDAKKTVLFAYKDDPLKPLTPITIVSQNLFSNENTPTYPWIPPASSNWGVDPLFHQVEYLTGGSQSLADVVLTLSSPGYVTEVITAGRFVVDVNTIKFTGSELSGLKDTYAGTYRQKKDNKGTARVSLDEIGASSTGGKIAKGQGIVLRVQAVETGHSVFWVRFSFKSQSGVVFDPESLVPSIGTISRYPSMPEAYFWTIPKGNQVATITIEAPESRDCEITELIVKTLTENPKYYTGGVVETN